MVLDELAKRRSLLRSEIADVQRLCAKLETPSAIYSDKALAQRASNKKDSDAKAKSKGVTVQAKQEQRVFKATLEKEHSDCSTERLDFLLDQPAITLDPQMVWRAYLSALKDGTPFEAPAFKRLIDYCSSLGYIGGKQFLMQLESDLSSKLPDYLNVLQSSFITTYAKLGSLDDAQRCYQMANRDGNEDKLDWSLCLAFFWGLCQKKGQALFDTRFVARNLATPMMFGLLLHEYAMMRNVPAVYSLFATMKRIGIEPNSRAMASLAQACALDTDIERGTRSLADVVAFSRSWGCSLDFNFVAGLLQGYNASYQNEMFDAVASKVDLDAIDLNHVRVYSVIMKNAARRGKRKLVRKIAQKIAIDERQGVLQAVQALGAVGDIDMARAVCGAHTRRFAKNNITANMLLELALADASTDPLELAVYARSMVDDGFTPSLRLFANLIDRLWLRSGVNLALSTFDYLLAAGAPVSIGILLKIVHLRLKSSAPYLALDTFEAACDQLRNINVGRLHLHDKTMHKIMELLMRQKGIFAAFEAFELFQSLSVNQSTLPYGLIIEYCLNHNYYDRAHSLIRQVVQHDIKVSHQVAKACCQYFLLHSTVSDTVNFLRYLQRTRTLGYIEYENADSVLWRCVEAGRMTDFQWIIDASTNYPSLEPAWGRLVDRFAPSNSHALLIMVRLIVLDKENTTKAALALLRSCTQSSYRAVAAEMVLRVMSEEGLKLSYRVVCKAFSYIMEAWVDIKNQSFQSKAPFLTLSYLSEALYRNMVPALNAGINKWLLVRILRVISSMRPDAYEDCLNLLRMYLKQKANASLFGAIASGCARWGSIKGIDAVLEEARNIHSKPTSNLLTSMISAYSLLPIPASAKARMNQAVPAESHKSLGISSHNLEEDNMMDEEESQTFVKLAQKTQDFPEQPYKDIIGHQQSAVNKQYEIDSAAEFHKVILSKILHIWGDFRYFNLSIPRAAYTLAIRACIRSHEYHRAESFVVDMAANKMEHDYFSILQVLDLYLHWDRQEYAFLIFNSMGHPDKCEQFGGIYLGLDKIQRRSEHFSLIIDYYLSNRQLQNAMSVMREMHGLDIGASPRIYTRIFRYFADADMRNDFVDTMRQVSRVSAKVNQEMLSVIKEFAAKNPSKDSNRPES
ncbi:hypothetical protein J3B02_000938 [Coemansia erecta]|nr:hypothetical protein J3B02_000938 [Coemansia erecta]